MNRELALVLGTLFLILVASGTAQAQSSRIADQYINASQINGTTIYQNGYAVLDTNSLNTTQFENDGGELHLLDTFFSNFFDALFSGKDTDDLTEGSSNKYDNTSWSESRAGQVFISGSNTTDDLPEGSINKYDNESWNQSFADSRYFTGTTTDDLTEGSTNLYDNSSWNETHAAGRFFDDETDITCTDIVGLSADLCDGSDAVGGGGGGSGYWKVEGSSTMDANLTAGGVNAINLTVVNATEGRIDNLTANVSVNRNETWSIGNQLWWLADIFTVRATIQNLYATTIYQNGYAVLDTNSLNTTQFENDGGELHLLDTFFSNFFDALFGGKTTDDLAEGSSNKYDNTSWTENRAGQVFLSGSNDTDDLPEGATNLYSTLTNIQTATSSDFHNIGGTDDDVPESGDFGNAGDLEADGTLSADVVAAAEMADADHGDVAWSSGVATVENVQCGSTCINDVEVNDTISVNSTEPINSTKGFIILVSGQKACLDPDCTYYAIHNTTTNCAELRNSVTGSALGAC